ncbi:MAG: hypothetical protein GF346_04200 [Candidatus Eisenbacteria bacterium]|nr:hypothetical protein [Candidatus Latescibacterota bacterium]MBD3301628.1 hypothetical protein [Candidatus Eisenbacteria bacterium]
MRSRIYLWTAVAVALAGLVPAGPAVAQIEGNLSSYTGQNAEGYLKPLQEGFGAALHSGIFRSAYIPVEGFHVNVEVKTMLVDFGDDDRTFDAETEAGFFPDDPGVTSYEAPTVIGDTTAVRVDGQSGTVAYFPGGFDVGSIGVAVPQITIGSFRGTQGIFRYIALDTGDAELGDLSLIGLGARHSISQYLQDSPVDLAAMVFWQNFKLGDDLVDATALTLGVQASRQYSAFEPYLGIAYDSFGMTVDYESEAAAEKLSVDFETESNLHITAGLGINFSVVHLHGEISTSSQTSYAVGLSVGN